MHELGFVFVDLKPENILITGTLMLTYLYIHLFLYICLRCELIICMYVYMYVCACVATGHVKVADFGGARPLSDRARVEVEQSRGLLKALRSGDWRDTCPTTAATTTTAAESQSMTEDEHLIDEEGKEEVHYDQKYDGQEEEEDRLEGTPGYMAPEVSLLHSLNTFIPLSHLESLPTRCLCT